MNSLYNSIRELKSRILLLLKVSYPKFLSEQMILAIDFITIYGKEFNISNYNLHGNGQFKYCEISSKKELINLALKELVLNNLIALNMDFGICYRINENGLKFIEKFNCAYSKEYCSIVKNVLNRYGDFNESVLLKLIQKKSIISIKGEKDV